MRVTVLDAPPGSGKSTCAIQEVRSHPERKYVICTPFLDEIDRFKEECKPRIFTSPDNYTSTKIDDFNDRLEKGEDISVTHVTFLNSSDITRYNIEQWDYHLIIDEVVDPLCEFNKSALVENDIKQFVDKKDRDLLLNEHLISVNVKTGKVEWIGKSYDGGKFSAIERMAKNGRLYMLDGYLFVCVFPPEIFSAFQSVTILTHMFMSSPLRAYFDKYSIEYELKSVNCTHDAKGKAVYKVVEYSTENDNIFKAKIKPLITVVDNKSLNYDTTLNKSWYIKNRKGTDTQKLKAHFSHFFKNVCHASVTREEIMWTAPSDYEKVLSGERYTSTKRIAPQNADHKQMLDEARKMETEKEFSKHLRGYVPSNARATNKYRFRWALAYGCDIFYNRSLLKFYVCENDERVKNGLPEIKIDDKAFGLSCFLQWMMRSRLRDGKPVVIYIPSKRIREVFLDWLHSDSVTEKAA